MGLIEWILTEAAAVILRVVSALIADDARAQIPKLTERVIAFAVSKLPEAQRGRYSNEWRSCVFDTSGELCKLRFACGLVFASLKMARDLRDRPEPEVAIQNSLLGVERLTLGLAELKNVNERLMVACQNIRGVMGQFHNAVTVQLFDVGYVQSIDRSEALGRRRLENLRQDFEMCRRLTYRLTRASRLLERHPTRLTAMLVRAEIQSIERVYGPRIRASSAEKRAHTEKVTLLIQEHREVLTQINLKVVQALPTAVTRSATCQGETH